MKTETEKFVKPTIEQTKWVLDHLCDHMNEGGSYRYLIYERLGYGVDAYGPLLNSGMALSNAFYDLNTLRLKPKDMGNNNG